MCVFLNVPYDMDYRIRCNICEIRLLNRMALSEMNFMESMNVRPDY